MPISEPLQQTITKILNDGKGILAADETPNTIGKHFLEPNGVENTEENRRAWRELLFTTPDIGNYISGVILQDETIRQSAADGRTFVQVLTEAGVVPGIKVDLGTEPMPESSQEKLTKGLDTLPERLREYANLGARFAKWRAVITIGDTPLEQLPTAPNIRHNAIDLATYAKECQKLGIVPIVEPEVLMDGKHSMKRCSEVTRNVLDVVFEELNKAGVALGGILLKPNMIVPGKESGETKLPGEIAEETVYVLNKSVPHDVPGIVFLSGGQTEAEATANLQAMAKIGPHPWKLSFSYGRALQESAAKAWAGKVENVPVGQEVFLNRARLNSLAAKGEYAGE